MATQSAPNLDIDPADDAEISGEAINDLSLNAPGLDSPAESILGVIDSPIFLLDNLLTIQFANMAGESFIGRAFRQLKGQPLSRVLPNAVEWLPIVERARNGGMKTAERGISVQFPGEHTYRSIDFSASPLGEGLGYTVVYIKEISLLQSVDHRMGFLGAARSVTGMAAVLAHEIKNPLSGIRGASQLLETAISESDRPLTELIRAEVDRICGLVDRMTVSTRELSTSEARINIHEVLDRVQQLAETGFGAHVRFVTLYDPSLPAVKGDRDLLIQAFLNLVKNAAEACPKTKGRVTLSTAYRSGIGMALPEGGGRNRLGVEVTVADNGPGIDPAIRDSLFEPFITSKAQGSGLGLALTAKIISDLGGMIDCESGIEQDAKGPFGTAFRTLLPIHTETEQGDPVQPETTDPTTGAGLAEAAPAGERQVRGV